MTALLATLTLLVACSGGSSGSGATSASDAGTVYVAMMDADGDFLRYEVDIVSIRLRSADGSEVDTLPRSTRLDFAQYLDLAELFTAAQVPAGRYLRAEITLDYTAADVQVEVAGNATPAVVRNTDGHALGRYTLAIELGEDRGLVVRPGVPALLTVDFDLPASHQVDLAQSPPVVTAAPLLVADVEPVASQQLRARGALVGVDAATSSYVIDLRPFHRPDGEFGEFAVHTTGATTYEINGAPYAGAAGLAALSALPPGTPTVAFGTLDVGTRRFSARIVHAGDSVPGASFDVVAGNVTQREGDTIVVRGALLVPREGQVRFHDDVRVTIGAGTSVHRRGEPGAVEDGGAISVGQRVEIFGALAPATTTEPPVLDADPGRVRLVPTQLAGLVNDAGAGQLRLRLTAIDGRRIGIFDFSGTGSEPALDADPASYEIATGALDLANLAAGEPARVLGWVRPFGQAPDDFEATTVADRADGGALLVIGWGLDGTLAPFAVHDDAQLVPDLGNPDIGAQHHLLIDGVVIDLASLPTAPAIVPAGEGPLRLAIAVGPEVQLYAQFEPFSARLAELLDGSRRAYVLHAEGHFDRDDDRLVARAIAVNLAPPRN